MLRNVTALFFLILLSACSSFKVEEELTFSISLETLRPMQSRSFHAYDRAALTAASAEALTEMGYKVEQQEPGLGFVTATQRVNAFGAAEVLQITAIFLLAALTRGNLPGGGEGSGLDDHEIFSANVVILPDKGENELVRLTLQRALYNTSGRITEIESVDEQKVYEDFFKRVQSKLDVKPVAMQVGY